VRLGASTGAIAHCCRRRLARLRMEHPGSTCRYRC
jgi:hypothetical protein